MVRRRPPTSHCLQGSTCAAACLSFLLLFIWCESSRGRPLRLTGAPPRTAVLVPMPWMLFGTDSDAANDPDVQGWVDAGKFLTGASAVGTIAIPAILFHAGKIVVGSFLCELAAALVLGTTAVAYLNLGSSDEYMVCLNTPKFGRPQSRSRADTAASSSTAPGVVVISGAPWASAVSRALYCMSIERRLKPFRYDPACASSRSRKQSWSTRKASEKLSSPTICTSRSRTSGSPVCPRASVSYAS